jgi:hypothetical protein
LATGFSTRENLTSRRRPAVLRGCHGVLIRLSRKRIWGVNVFWAEADTDDARRNAAKNRKVLEQLELPRKLELLVTLQDFTNRPVLDRDLHRLRGARGKQTTALHFA